MRVYTVVASATAAGALRAAFSAIQTLLDVPVTWLYQVAVTNEPYIIQLM